jgi:DUF1680 family protein
MGKDRAAGRYRPLPLEKVRITDEFWGPRLRANREGSLPAVHRKCKETGRIDAFKLDWREGGEPVPHMFWDSDVAKWIEAASYSLTTDPDPDLEALVKGVVDLVVAAQQPDGYLNVHYTVVAPESRWANLRDCHELYCAGHLMEAAVAHCDATGDRRLLDAMQRYADYIETVFGRGPGKKRGYGGHEEIELALIKLYRASGEERYLRMSQYFVEERGQRPYYFDLEARVRGDRPREYWAKTYEYCQAHAPVREQPEVVGHAVRAMYLYCAMADLAGELNDVTLLDACRRLWDDLCLRRVYLTGGIGPSAQNEGFTGAYDLPNDTAYAETCAAIGLVLWGHRLLQLDCDSRYSDVLERALYNGVLSGVSLDGKKFFYVNPLSSGGGHHRREWFDCACCPPNIARLVSSLGSYIYSQSEDGFAVHLYVQGEAEAVLPEGTPIRLQQRTRYPWDGQVVVSVDPGASAEFSLRLRLPGWCRRHAVRLNGEPVEPALEKGYLCLRRTWDPVDVVELEFDMPVERMAAHPEIAHDRGRLALQRGPLVYCVEDVDHTVSVHQLAIPEGSAIRARHDDELLGGVVVIEGDGQVSSPEPWRGDLYLPADRVANTAVKLRAIPYFAWDNREPGGMAVWLLRG